MDPFLIPQIIDLAGENPVKTYRQPLASGDSGAHTWEVRIVRGGVAVDLTGCTATLNVRRDGDSDEATLRKRATIAGNRVSCELPRGVYELGGKLTAVMIVEDSAGRVVTAAVLLLRGKQYITDHIADPDGTLPTVKELLQRVSAMEGTVSQLKNDLVTLQDKTRINYLRPTLQTHTENDVTITNNGDGTYTLNGTATNLAMFSLGIFRFKKNKEYKLVGCPLGGGWDTKYVLNIESSPYIDTGNGYTFSFTDDVERRIFLDVFSGCTCENLVFKPMITDDLSATYDDFVSGFDCFTPDLKMDLLWTNASPTTEFAPQKIELDLSDATLIVIEYRLHHNYDVTVQLMISEPNTDNVRHKTSDEKLFYRVIEHIKSDGIYFGNAGSYETYGNGTTTTNNNLLIPYKIFEIK